MRYRSRADTLERAQRYGDDVALVIALFLRGLILAQQDSPHRADEACTCSARSREAAGEQSVTGLLPSIRPRFATRQGPHARSRRGDSAASCAPTANCSAGTNAVLRMLQRPLIWWSHCCVAERTPTCRRPQAAIERLAAAPTDPGFGPEAKSGCCGCARCWRAAHGDDAAYRDYRDRYRAMATSLGFEGHMKWAEAMP